MKNILIIIVVLLIIGGGGYFLFGSRSSGEECTPETAPVLDSSEGVATASADLSFATITFNNGEVALSCVKVFQGEEVKWVNAGDKNIQVAANPHPVHSGNKEVSNGEFVLELAPGEEKSITINKVGKVGYHDHLNSATGGVIIVE